MTPQETYGLMAQMGRDKISAPWHKQAVQGVMAGAYVALGGLFANLMEGGIYDPLMPHGGDNDPDKSMPFHALSNLLGGAVFPVGLIAIFLTGANLYTGNCMYLIPPLLTRSVPPGRALGWLLFSWVMNFVGALSVAYFIAYLGEWTSKPPVRDYVIHNAAHKCGLTFTVALLRGVGAK